MRKALARVLVTLLLLLLGTATACSSIASHQGDCQDAHQLRKLQQSKPFTQLPFDFVHVIINIIIISSSSSLVHIVITMQGAVHGRQYQQLARLWVPRRCAVP